MNTDQRRVAISILAVILITLLTIYAYEIRDQVLTLERYGYPGIFLIELIANASVFLPIPGSLVTAAVSPLLNPFVLALVASTGAALGELSAYAAGLGGNVIIQRAGWYERIQLWIQKYGGLTILVMAAVPNPLFDTAGLAAGALRIRVYEFFIWCWLGKTINRLVIVFGGAALLSRLPFLH